MNSETSNGRRILVFCASSASCATAYHDAAATLGRAIAEAGDTLVYGGGAVGSMGALANAALEHGGSVVGVIPRFMRELEWAHPGLTHLQMVEDMHDRKRDMLKMADAIVALPGGSGTFEELFEAITQKRLGLFPKPIIILNQDGFYEPLFSLLKRSVEERFMSEKHLEIWHSVADVNGVMPAIHSAPEWPEDAIQFATR